MARQGFFDSTTVTEDPVTGLPVGDKAEGSDFLADTLYAILGNGVSMTPTSNLLVSPSTGLIVRLKAGKLWKNGYKLWEETDRTITFTSSASEQTFYISGRLDVASGEFTNGEVYPYTTFVSATDVCVAKIVIPANALTITDAMITDYRYSTTYCGVVDEYRLQLEAIAADFETALAELESVGLPHHASTHAAGQADAISLTSIATAGIDYADQTTVSTIIRNGFFTGGAVTAQSTPNQTVAVASGVVVTPEGKKYSFSAVSSLSAAAADATNPRIDIVYVSSTGVVTYLAGTAAASPSQPSTPTNGTVLATIVRAANDNTIATADITSATVGKYGVASIDSNGKVAASQSSSTIVFNSAGNHTLIASHAGRFILEANATSTVVTVPKDVFPLGTEIEVCRWWGAGAVSFTAASGVYIYSLGGALSIVGTYGVAVLKQCEPNVWLLSGAIT